MSGSRALPLRVVALACFLGTGLLVAALGMVWARESGQPRVVLLGSGGTVSVLVISGDARVLIATGSDPAAFATALEAARQPVQRRIDVLLAAGRGDDLLVPAAIAADVHVRMVATLGQLDAGPDHASLADRPALTEGRNVTLGGDVTVLLEARPIPGEDDADPGRWAWRATVSRGDARVVVLSDGPAAALFGPPVAPGLVVVAGRDPLAAMAPGTGTGSPALAFADRALSPRTMRQAAATVPAHWAIRVFDGEAIFIPLSNNALAFPPEATVPLAPAAPATPGS